MDSWIERAAGFRRRPIAAALIGAVLLALAIGVRVVLNAQLGAFPFITFFPAIMLAALLAGARVAAVLTLIAGLISWYFFVPPTHSLNLSLEAAVGLAFFAFVAAVIITLVEMLHRALERGRSDRARAEALLSAREAMFKELQHRVANNMQFVSAMLAMQQRQLEGTAAGDALAQAATRLRAMSRIHRRLYDPANADRAFGPLVEELCHELLEATGARNIVCRVDIPPLSLAPDRVHALSMIVTEAMTNAVKYAFPNERPGTIRITLERLPEDQMLFSVIDDGAGVAPDFDVARSTSLGMKIMQALAQQVNGVVTIGPANPGTELRLRFQPT